MIAIHLTKNGEKKLREELKHLKNVERPAVILAIAEARAHGDLSENADYSAAKEKQSFIEGRILEIESKLSKANVIDPDALDADGRIVFGATVSLLELQTQEIFEYQIVGDDEADVAQGMISLHSPIAKALIGKEAGAVVIVRAPIGDRKYEILSVKY